MSNKDQNKASIGNAIFAIVSGLILDESYLPRLLPRLHTFVACLIAVALFVGLSFIFERDNKNDQEK
jgi:hypothetical protein